MAIQSSLSGLTPGTTYYYRIVATNSQGTVQGEIRSFTTQAGPPSATTGSATATGSSATINGTANPNHGSTSTKFEWGKTSSLGSATGSQSIGNGTSNVAVSSEPDRPQADDDLLLPRGRAELGGTANGSIKTFTTTADLPACVTAGAGSITTTGAKIAGTVDPGGAATNATFNYGKTSSFGSTTAAKSVGSGTDPVSTDATLTGLTPNTTYYFRVAGSNSKGTCTGSSGSFKTLPIAPTATTGSASSITKSTAVLGGSSNANGAATTGYFEYGKTTSFGSKTGNVSFGSGTSVASATASISGL